MKFDSVSISFEKAKGQSSKPSVGLLCSPWWVRFLHALASYRIRASSHSWLEAFAVGGRILMVLVIGLVIKVKFFVYCAGMELGFLPAVFCCLRTGFMVEAAAFC